MKKIAVFASGAGTTFNYLIERGHQKDFLMVALVTNNHEAGAIEVANSYGIPVLFSDEEGYEEKLGALAPDLLIDAGYLKLIPKSLCDEYQGRFINTHPSLLPKYGGKGFYGEHIYRHVLENKDKETGITIHELNECYDDGAILCQRRVEVLEGDTLESLQERVQAAEKPFLYETVLDLLKDKPKRALLSVFYKDGILELAKALREEGVELISSGGTYKHLKDHGLEVQEVQELTNFPEMLGGRVKTLHPFIHGGLLAKRKDEEHMKTIHDHGIMPIDMVVVNLYPFEEMLKKDLSFEEMIEYIDIGGPSMLRSAAKNHEDVIVLQDPRDYDEFLERFRKNRLTKDYRKSLAAKVFQTTSRYDSLISSYLTGEKEYPGFSFKHELRYGENPHQKAYFYEEVAGAGFLKTMHQYQGKELSYSNLCDIEAAFGTVIQFEGLTCVAVKHNTPCGIAQGKDALDTYTKCHASDPVSIFGGIVALNGEVDGDTARKMTETFLEVVCALSFTEEALEVFKAKKNLRVVKLENVKSTSPLLKSVSGGLLVQERDEALYENLECVTERKPTEEEMKELLFSYQCVKEVKSNAIVVVKDYQTVGIGGGQVNRIDAARLALRDTKGAKILASDGFFPFDDVVRLAHEKGITMIIQPGGSLQDQKSIDACNELGIAMVFTHMRHFKH